VKNASAKACIISNKYNMAIRREYRERVKIAIYSGLQGVKYTQDTICRFLFFPHINVKVSME